MASLRVGEKIWHTKTGERWQFNGPAMTGQYWVWHPKHGLRRIGAKHFSRGPRTAERAYMLDFKETLVNTASGPLAVQVSAVVPYVLAVQTFSTEFATRYVGLHMPTGHLLCNAGYFAAEQCADQLQSLWLSLPHDARSMLGTRRIDAIRRSRRIMLAIERFGDDADCHILGLKSYVAAS